jgi:RNA polymerase sigma-70 factor (ECF subfamily)
MDAGGGLAEVAARGAGPDAGVDAREATGEADLERRFAAFVGSHRERARRLAWRLVGGDAGAAEDVAQDAFLRAWRSLDRFRGEASLSTWFYRILVRQAANHRRWRGVRERMGGWGNPDAAGDPPPRGDPGLRERIGRAMESLTRRQREVFVLVHLEGFTVRETAMLLGRPEGTVKSHLHRALARLRRDLSNLREPDGGVAGAPDVEPAAAGAPGAAPRAHEEPKP